jgi:hypothetical protein
LLPSADMGESELRSDSPMSADGSKYGSTSAKCCNYSLNVPLMMDENIIRNM